MSTKAFQIEDAEFHFQTVPLQGRCFRDILKISLLGIISIRCGLLSMSAPYGKSRQHDTRVLRLILPVIESLNHT